MRRVAGVLACVVLGVSMGCGNPPTDQSDAGLTGPDAADDVDAGDVDAGVPDAGPIDAGTPDAGDLDAGLPDAAPQLTLFEGAPLPPPDEVLGTAQGLGAGVRDASHDAAGNLWAVDSSKIYVRRAGMGAFESFGTDDGLTGQEVLAVGGGVAGVAWVGYRGQGDDTGVEPIEWRDTGGVGRVALSGADVDVTNLLLVSPPGRYPKYPDGRYKLRTCIRAYAVKSGQHAGDAWFGCNHGIGLVSKDYGVIEHHHPAKCLWDPVAEHCTDKVGWVGALAFTPGGDVWMGGDYGVMLLDYTVDSGPGHFWGLEPVRNQPLFVAPLSPNSYGSEDLVAVAVAPDGSLWAASSHSGLAHRHANGDIDVYQEADGLPSNHLADIAMDSSGQLWVATAEEGVFRLDVSTGEWRAATGLPSSETNRLVAEQVAGGERVTATVHGAVVVWNAPVP